MLERDLLPGLESFLACAPDVPPTDAKAQQQLLLGLVQAYWPHLPVLIGALDQLIDGVSIGLDDLLDNALRGDDVKRRPLHHLEEALASLVRVASATATLIARHRSLGELEQLQATDLTALTDELRPYLLGVASTLVGLDRIDGSIERLAPWAWMARRETLKSEGVFMVELRKLGAEPPRPRRIAGDLTGRLHVPDDFDAPLPKDIEDSFYESNL